MRKIVTLFVIAISVLEYSNAQDTWNAVKVFELTDAAGNVGKMYIDSIGSSDGDAVFCFHTKIDSFDKIIRTDFDGNLIDVTNSPSYSYFTVFNGDTIYINYPGGAIVNATNGDTIYKSDTFDPIGIASSSTGLYTHLRHSYRSPIPPVVNVMTGIGIYNTWSTLSGLCCGEGVVYILELQNDNSLLTYVYEDLSDRNQAIVSVDNPNGIGVYRGSLYVYSQTDKAVYRLEPSEGTAVNSVYKDILETTFYNLAGVAVDKPSGLTIVVTRYTDGSIRTEKKLFKN